MDLNRVLEDTAGVCECGLMNDEAKPRREKLTSYGEPLWLDVIKTLGVALSVLGGVIGVGAILVLAIVAPWGRESFDCSIWCVIEREIFSFVGGGKPDS